MVVCETLVAEWLLWVCPLMSSFGYSMVFLVNLIGSASIFLPIPGFALVFFMPSMGFNPWLLAVFGALGAALGEITGYALGVGGRLIAEKHKERQSFFQRLRGGLLDRAKKWSEKRGIFVLVVVFAATPLPHDIIGIIAGAIGYDLKKFLLATFIGKLIMLSVLAWGGYFGMEFLLDMLAGGL